MGIRRARPKCSFRRPKSRRYQSGIVGLFNESDGATTAYRDNIFFIKIEEKTAIRERNDARGVDAGHKWEEVVRGYRRLGLEFGGGCAGGLYEWDSLGSFGES